MPKSGGPGPAVARTEAIKRASGQYIAFGNNDDLWLPDKLEKQISFMEKEELLFHVRHMLRWMPMVILYPLLYIHLNKLIINGVFAYRISSVI